MYVVLLKPARVAVRFAAPTVCGVLALVNGDASIAPMSGTAQLTKWSNHPPDRSDLITDAHSPSGFLILISSLPYAFHHPSLRHALRCRP